MGIRAFGVLFGLLLEKQKKIVLANATMEVGEQLLLVRVCPQNAWQASFGGIENIDRERSQFRRLVPTNTYRPMHKKAANHRRPNRNGDSPAGFIGKRFDSCNLLRRYCRIVAWAKHDCWRKWILYKRKNQISGRIRATRPVDVEIDTT